MSINNVFSNNSDTISILVHTESYLKNISALEFLVNANKLKRINVYFLPVLSRDVDVPVTTGSYTNIKVNCRVHTSINFKNYSEIIHIHKYSTNELDEEAYYKETEEHIVNGEISTDTFNYIVVENKEDQDDINAIPVIDFDTCKAEEQPKAVEKINKKELRRLTEILKDESVSNVEKNKVARTIFKEIVKGGDDGKTIKCVFWK